MSESQGAPATTGGTVLDTGAAAPPAGAEWLPEEYRADPVFKDIKDTASLAKSYKHAASMVGLDKGAVLRLPDRDDAPEWGEVWGRLGRPEKPDGYGLKAPHEALPAEMLTAFGERAHAAGLSKRQAETVVGFYGEQLAGIEKAQAEAAEKATAEAQAALKGEWGNAYEEKIGEVRRLLEIAGGPDVVKAVNEAGLGRSVPFLKAMVALAGQVREPDGLKGGASGGMGRTMTPAEAQAQIGAKQRDAEFQKAYWTADHPGHAEAVREMNALFAAAHPEQAARG